jgi:DNA-binding MarR family transcriptional regulator
MTVGPAFGNRLVGLSVLIQRRYAQICADHDLTPAQAQLLCMIKDGPRGMSELGAPLGLARPGLSGLVDRTERRGLVHRETPDHDRRAVVLSTTALGQKTAEALYADVGALVPDILGTLSPEERHTFEKLLEQVPFPFGGRCDGDC